MAFDIHEIKVKCASLEPARACLLAHKATFKGIDQQEDTYFNVGKGRLKLREGQIENNLIQYARENKKGSKTSNVRLMPIAAGEPLKEMLLAALGSLVVVNKKREIYFIDNVKFHLDTVDQLGTFIEIEAIGRHTNKTEKELKAQCEFYINELQLQNEEQVAHSYSDFLIGL